jgi:hypothetical protein
MRVMCAVTSLSMIVEPSATDVCNFDCAESTAGRANHDAIFLLVMLLVFGNMLLGIS